MAAQLLAGMDVWQRFPDPFHPAAGDYFMSPPAFIQSYSATPCREFQLRHSCVCRTFSKLNHEIEKKVCSCA